MKTIEETRCPTGIPSFDEALKGGLPGGIVVGIVGPPGSCKSVFGVQLGLDRARKNGGKLYCYSPDQGGTQPLTRLASSFGDIVGDEGAFERFLSEFDGLIRVADEREPGVTMESFVAAVLEAKDCAAVLIDTPQTVVTAADDEGERARIDSAMESARLLAGRLLVPVFVPNHANRASTAARKKDDRTLPRASALGSAKVEHRSQVLVFMERIDREDGQTEVEVTLPKVAFGSAGKVFRLILDPTAWRMREIDRGAREDAEADAAETARRKLLIDYKDKIRKVLKPNPDGLSGKALEERCGGRLAHHRAARLEMADEGELITEERSGRGGGLVWKLPIRRA
jgi:KaiC/GvpD/RAD55 family RecA-like ATPase